MWRPALAAPRESRDSETKPSAATQQSLINMTILNDSHGKVAISGRRFSRSRGNQGGCTDRGQEGLGFGRLSVSGLSPRSAYPNREQANISESYTWNS